MFPDPRYDEIRQCVENAMWHIFATLRKHTFASRNLLRSLDMLASLGGKG